MSSTHLEYITGLLAFFEIWNFPLTLAEIQKFLGEEDISEDLLKTNFFSIQSGADLYFSTGENISELLRSRIESELISDQLRNRAQRFLGMLRHFPFIRGLALTNTPAMGVASRESDIDLFVVTASRRIWTARFFSTFFFQLLGLRTEKGKTRGKFCLSFFVDENFMDFLPIKNEQDIYLAFWLATMQPLSGSNFFQKLRQENRDWIEKEAGIQILFDDVFKPDQKSRWQKFWEFLLPQQTENFFRKLLLKKAQKFRDPNSPEFAPEMIFSDQIQKLHHPDLRPQIQQRWAAKLRNFQTLKKTPEEDIIPERKEDDHSESAGEADHQQT